VLLASGQSKAFTPAIVVGLGDVVLVVDVAVAELLEASPVGEGVVLGRELE
jgi:hypothetical protein